MDLIIVLGAQNDAQGRLSAMALARARGALDEYRRRTGSRLVVTGGYGHFNAAPLPHAHYMAAHLIEQGVDPDHILARVESAHTVEDAALTCPLLDAFAESGRAASARRYSNARESSVAPRHKDAPSTVVGHGNASSAIVVVTSDVHVPRAQLIFGHFYPPARLVVVGTPDACTPERLQAIRAHESEQIERIHRQGGVIYRGRLIRHQAKEKAG